MSEIPQEIFWSSLETPIPKSMEFRPNASVEVDQLQKDKQFLTMALVGLGIIASVLLIYLASNSNQDEKRKTR